MKKIAIIVGTAVLGAGFIVGSIAFAAGPGMAGHLGIGIGVGARFEHGGVRTMSPGIFGTVSAINGATLTVTQDGFDREASTTANESSYTVNTSGATVVKNGASSTIASIAVGDKVMVRGAVSGTSITATTIIDGMVPGGPRMAPQVLQFQGNGEPVVGGAVTAINSSTLIVTNKSNITYTVNGLNATIIKDNTTSSLAAVSVNDNVLIQGTVNGTSITATSIVDQGTPGNGSATANTGTSGGKGGFVGGMFGGIGTFFRHLFGFF